MKRNDLPRSDEEIARLRQTRAHFAQARPSLAELVTSGDYVAAKQGEYLELMRLLAGLKEARKARHLSLAEVANRSGIDKGALSRLENGRNQNPTFMTLEAVARAIGVRLRVSIED